MHKPTFIIRPRSIFTSLHLPPETLDAVLGRTHLQHARPFDVNTRLVFERIIVLLVGNVVIGRAFIFRPSTTG